MFLASYPPTFPLDDVIAIAADLMTSGSIVPGFIPGALGVFDLRALEYAKLMGETIVILPDRNIISRIVAIAQGRARAPLDKPTQVAADLMALCQCMRIDFEPLVAMQELAQTQGNEAANLELAWFRAADRPQSLAWVSISRGRSSSLGDIAPERVEKLDLATPPGRWTRNYVAALKIAELELSTGSPIMRAIRLFDWMMDSFFLAGPAALFASMYFSPNASKKRLMKHLRSAVRNRALDGIRNAAWDMTYLSDLTSRVSADDDGSGRFIFATADEGLAQIARRIAVDAEEGELKGELVKLISGWWSDRDARVLAERFSAAML